jgi:ubiquinone/menaquinone biosynthesis C-methylase UbiE
MHEYWLDIGAGINAEHWAATQAAPGIRLVALDPLLTSGMVTSGRLAPLGAQLLRVGAEVRPEHSVEAEKQRAYLPFRDHSFTHVHCGFVLHLYLETLELLVAEMHRVLQPGGTVEVLLPHFGDLHSERTLARTEDQLLACFGHAELTRFTGPFTTFWADLYRDRTYRVRCIRAD